MTPQEEIKQKRKFPQEMLLMGDCPNCGEERNGKFVEDTIDEIVNLSILEFIDQEIERKKGMRKELPQIKKLPEKYKDNIEVNPETISIVMNNVIAMNYIGHYEYGYNKAIDEDIAHLTSLKELIK